MKVNRVVFIKWIEFQPTVQGFDIPQNVHMFQPRQLQCDNWRISSEGTQHLLATSTLPSSEETSGLLQVLGIISWGCHPSESDNRGPWSHHHLRTWNVWTGDPVLLSDLRKATVVGKIQIFSQLVVKHGDLSWHILKKTSTKQIQGHGCFFVLWRALSF